MGDQALQHDWHFPQTIPGAPCQRGHRGRWAIGPVWWAFQLRRMGFAVTLHEARPS